MSKSRAILFSRFVLISKLLLYAIVHDCLISLDDDFRGDDLTLFFQKEQQTRNGERSKEVAICNVRVTQHYNR